MSSAPQLRTSSTPLYSDPWEDDLPGHGLCQQPSTLLISDASVPRTPAKSVSCSGTSDAPLSTGLVLVDGVSTFATATAVTTSSTAIKGSSWTTSKTAIKGSSLTAAVGATLAVAQNLPLSEQIEAKSAGFFAFSPRHVSSAARGGAAVTLGISQVRPSIPLNICDLPHPLIHEILHHLTAKDLGRISCACKALCQLVSESPGWQRFYCDRWRPPASFLRRPQTQGAQVPPRATSATVASNCIRGSSLSAPADVGAQRSSGSRGIAAVADGRQSRSPEWWRQLYLHKEKRSAALSGRYDQDWFTGHTAGVRCVAVLPQAPIAVSAGYDSTVRLWDLDSRLPLAASAPLGETLRAVAADWDFLAVGGTHCVVRVWPLAVGCPHFFDVDGLWDLGGASAECVNRRVKNAGEIWAEEGKSQAVFEAPQKQQEGENHPTAVVSPCCEATGAVCSPYVPALLSGHTGPVSCLTVRHAAGAAPRLFSGSWDGAIICWDLSKVMVCPEVVSERGRGRLRRIPSSERVTETLLARYEHQDWVWAAVARRGHLLSTAGNAQYSWDSETRALLRVRRGVHEGKANAVEASMSGHYVFTSGEDGYVRMFDERVKARERRREHAPESSGARDGSEQPVMEWLAHGAPVNSLSFEDPWLVSASSDGCCAVMEVGKTMRVEKRSRKKAFLNSSRGYATYEPMRRLGGGFGSILSVDMGHERVVCGCVDTAVRVLDFRYADGWQEPKKRGKKKGGGRRLVLAHES